MKSILSRLLLLLCLAAPFAAAAPDDTPKPERWVSPEAQAIIDRLDAAYAALDGWTATFVNEERNVRNGTERAGVIRSEERYLRHAGSVPFYSSANYYEDRLIQLVAQDSAEFRMISRGPEKFSGSLDEPMAHLRPYVRSSLETYLKRAAYVRVWGRETVEGRACDVLELISHSPAPVAEGEAKSAPVVTTVRCYVDEAGFIHRLVLRASGMDGTSSYWNDVRITFDPHAKLSAADFTRAAYEREAAARLQGAPMPELVESSFKPGATLPPAVFTAWADKQPFQLSDLKGKVVVLESWASWCYYCKQAFPFYEKMRQKLADQDVVFVAVSFDQKEADYEKWMNTHAGSYGFKFGRIQSDKPMKALEDFKASLPGFYVLGRDGRIVATYSGFGYAPGQEDPRLVQALRAAGVKL
jgi:thiol-disulfide isomerase/thioredoxin